MSLCFYYIVYCIVYAISLLPLKVLYLLTSIMYSVGWRLLGYRKSVIIQNLTRSFPDLMYWEIDKIANQYVVNLCNTTAEWAKSFSESKKAMLKRVKIDDNVLADTDKDVDLFLTLGHFGNWELLNIIPLFDSRPIYAIYKKQSSKVADFLSHKMRCRFGVKLLESKEAARFILSNQTPSIYIFIADQSPASTSKVKLQFLNQQTIAFEGIERLAINKNAQILYTEIAPIKLGVYHISFQKIFDRKDIVSSFFKNLELSIKNNPSSWLWSHRRWKHIVAVLLFCTGFTTVSNAQNVKIEGLLVDAKSRSAIDYATVVLYHTTDSTYVSGGLSDSTGYFRIAAPCGDYFLGVNHINYERHYQKIGHIKSDTTISQIFILPSTLNIAEVVVVGSSPSVRITNNKSIYKVSDIPSSNSGTLNDIFKSIPAITLDFNETALINGTPAKIFVNGREITSNELKAYSPSQIATIEIVSNPTAQYDANGLSGIIHLKTKHSVSEGVAGAVNISGAHDMQSGSANLSYNRNKLSLGSAFSIWNNHQHGSIETLFNGNSTSNNIQADILNLTANLSADYSFNYNNTLSASYQYIDFGYSSKDNSEYRVGESNMRGITHQIATSYKHQFAREGEMFKADVYYNQTNPQTLSLLNYADDNYTINNRNNNNSITATLDYYLPFTENANLEAGLKSHTRNISIYRKDDFSGSVESNKFSLHESILAAYVQMNSRMEKFNVQFGLRSETNLADKVDGSRKWDIFPNISLEYGANERNILKLGYNNRINRPSSADINPFVMMIDPTSTFKGNPNLKPEYSHNVFVDYINRYQGNEIKLSTYYRLVNNLITKTFENTTEGVLYSPVNIPTAHFFGVDLTANQSFGQMLTVQPSIGYSCVYIPSGTDKEFRNINTLNAGLSIGIKLPHNFSIQALGKYSSGALSVGTSSQSAIVQGLAIGLPQLMTEFSASKSLLNNNMTLSLRVTDPFNIQKNGFKVYSDNSLIESIYHMQTRFVYFSLSYRFNNFKSSARKYDDGGIKVF